jgi:hypothetical protein
MIAIAAKVCYRMNVRKNADKLKPIGFVNEDPGEHAKS